MKTMCLIIPTKDRPDAIDAYLAMQANVAGKLGIDILIQDSSESNKTQKIVEKWQRRQVCEINYFYYEEPKESQSIDNKVREISRIAAHKYEYLCFSSDGTILCLDRIWKYVQPQIAQQIDLIIQGTHRLDKKSVIYFSDSIQLLEKCVWRMVSLNSTIVSSRFMRACLAYDEECGDQPQDFWLPMIYFRFLAGRSDTSAVYLYMPDAIDVNPYISESFWRVQGKALWQWGERWCVVIDSLPSEYDSVKASVLLSHDAQCHVFSPRSIIGLRAYGNFSLEDIGKYKQYISRVTRTPILFFWMAAIFIRPGFAKILKKRHKQWKGLKV